MIKKTILILSSVLTLLASSSLALADTPVGNIKCAVNQVAGSSASNCTSPPPNAGPDLSATIAHVVNILSVLAGAIAVIMIIVAGLRFVTSAGSENAVAGAKKTITFAVIGLIVVALAQIIVHFVLNNIT
ncbi:MAG TPA: pilin [Candidatus Saccharimonadales bacterium]|nr:pilin [Candidatus Saccharimonadales bacterium]